MNYSISWSGNLNFYFEERWKTKLKTECLGKYFDPKEHA
jgi:hypothetical protein